MSDPNAEAWESALDEGLYLLDIEGSFNNHMIKPVAFPEPLAIESLSAKGNPVIGERLLIQYECINELDCKWRWRIGSKDGRRKRSKQQFGAGRARGRSFVWQTRSP
ncbi:hypothetical protein CMUS01_09487 [Colletotrichum musicola]|uniref:Uncharacterized protein n=1 Tax=Colletotrichum musicola TaxID=2175873 RepID=A0A8H6K788_9PEZI|nr:hypothetical protein CMUS01_09487 [Colletotrichum musicola]